jgi:hypothetical protein
MGLKKWKGPPAITTTGRRMPSLAIPNSLLPEANRGRRSPCGPPSALYSQLPFALDSATAALKKYRAAANEMIKEGHGN